MRVVEHIESFQPELDVPVFVPVELLMEHDVQIVVSRARIKIPARISGLSRYGICE